MTIRVGARSPLIWKRGEREASARRAQSWCRGLLAESSSANPQQHRKQTEATSRGLAPIADRRANKIVITTSKIMAEPSEPSPNTQQWWSKFGDAYDEAAKEELSKMGGAADEPSDGAQPSQPTAESQRAPRPEEALADQMVLNQRTLAQLRAKAQLLEVAETANARLQSELSELRATSEAREAALHKALGESRAAADALQASFTDAAAEAARCRQAAEQARSGVVSQGADHEEERTALNAMIKEAQPARRRATRR